MYHNLWFARNRCVFRILRRYGKSIDLRFYPKLLLTGAMAGLSTPLRLIESIVSHRAVERQKLRPPVFILGHWRSGTTNLHNLLLLDPRFGSVPLISCLNPGCFLHFGRVFRFFAHGLIPKSRPMDNVPTGLDEPMSEDFALAGISDLSHYAGYYFPRLLEETYRRSVFFEGCSRTEIERWSREYVYLLKKVTWADGEHRRLALKNPPNMGRIPAILKLFPDAKFIHIHRNPFIVHTSTCKLHESFARRFGLQHYNRSDLHSTLLRRQRLVCERYLTDRDLISPENLIEVRHEDVVARPEQIVREIYEHLRLDGFEDLVMRRLQSHIESNRDYRTNQYEFPDDVIAAVRDELQGMLDEWGYDVPMAAAAQLRNPPTVTSTGRIRVDRWRNPSVG